MNTLAQLQTEFQHALLADRALAPDRLSARSVAQFGVYRVAYRARLRAALRDNYEVLPRVMGDDAFDALANAYIDLHPSRHYSLRWYGAHLVEHMVQNPSLVDHTALIDLAQMERALRHAFDAANAPPLQPSELGSLRAEQWDTLVLALHPSVQLLSLQWAVGPIWHAVQSGADELPAPPALEHTLMVWRQDLHTQWKSLEPSLAVMVQGIAAGKTFGALCESLAALVGLDQAASTAAVQLQWLVQVQALVAGSAIP